MTASRLGLADPLRRALAKAALQADRGDFVRMNVLGVDMDLDPSEFMQSTAIVLGVYERDEVLAMLRLIQPGSVVVDVGANYGQFTLIAGRAVGPEGVVHAFEPFGPPFDRLRSNVLGSPMRDRIRLYRYGLGEQNCSVSLWAGGADERSGRNDGMTSAFADESHRSVAGEMTVVAWDELGHGRLDVVKLDCEGSELPALLGMENSLRSYRPRVLLEMNPVTFRAAGYGQGDVMKFLASLSYAMYVVGRGGTISPVTDRAVASGVAWTMVCLPDGIVDGC